MADAPRRVVQVVTQREPAGAQRVAHQLHHAFEEAGVESEVLFLYRRADAYDDEPYRDLRAARPGPVGTLGVLIELVRRWRADRPAAVIGHTFHANVLATLAAAAAGVPRRVAVHHVLADFESAARRAVLRLLRAARLAHHHVYVSQATLDSYGPAARRGAVVIHNGVDAPPAQGDLRWQPPRRRPDRPLLVAVGRLAAQKDHATLLAALEHLPEVELLVLGEGELRPALEAEVAARGLAERVTLLGNVPAEHVPAALAAADVVVQPSVWEAFSMVVLEAMAAGRPMVVSDIAAHREALGDHAGYHVVGDPAALAAAVRAVLDDPARARALGEGARRAAGAYAHAEVARRYLDLLGGAADATVGGAR